VALREEKPDAGAKRASEELPINSAQGKSDIDMLRDHINTAQIRLCKLNRI